MIIRNIENGIVLTYYIFDLDSIQSSLISENPFYYEVSNNESYELNSEISVVEIKNRFIDYLMNKDDK